jgi:hypothetical protein
VGAADLNGDGKLDLATPDTGLGGGTTASILLGNGDGTFQPYTDFTVGQNPDQIAIGDFNGDGRLDLAVANSSSDTVSVLLQATTVALSPLTLSFADQIVGTASTAQTLTLTNSGTTALNIDGIAAGGSFSQTNTCGSILAGGATCAIKVTFKPTAVGPYTAAVTVTGNAVGSPQSIPLSGTGVISGPNATLSATKLTFATQLLATSSTTQSVTLSNYGTAALAITSIIASEDFSQTNTCGSSLPDGASCIITETFKPTQVGKRTGTVSITDNTPSSPGKVNLTGVGTEVELNPSSLYFPMSGQAPITLTNVGNSALSIGSIAITGSDAFSETNNCGNGVAAGGSCIITVTFKQEEGEQRFGGDVVVSDNGGASPQQVLLTGSGKQCEPVCKP